MTAAALPPAGIASVHRMADPAVRRRAAATAALLLGLGYTIVTLVGTPNGVYSQSELRHLGGVPFAPPQIQRRVAPPIPGNELDQIIRDLQNSFSGSPSPQPSAGQTR